MSAKQSARSSPRPSCVKRHGTPMDGVCRSAPCPRKTIPSPKKGEESAVWSWSWRFMWQYCWTLLDIAVRFFYVKMSFRFLSLVSFHWVVHPPWRFNSLYNDVMEKVKCLWVARNSSTCYMTVPWWHVKFGRFLVSHMELETMGFRLVHLKTNECPRKFDGFKFQDVL